VAETTIKRLLCCGFRRTGKAMGQVYQCWCPSFEYHMSYVPYPFVTYLLSLAVALHPLADRWQDNRKSRDIEQQPSFVFWSFRTQTSVRGPAILTEVVRGFPQPLQTNARICPQIMPASLSSAPVPSQRSLAILPFGNM
jgi:hypothetical protein